MIVYQPEIALENDELCVSARVEPRKPIPHLPDRLWFKFPADYGDYVTDRSDGFLASLILMAMYFGEDLEVRGTVSPRLAQNVERLQDIYHHWLPKLFKRVKLSIDHLAALSPQAVQGGVATAFSGGIDSCYTVWSHTGQNQADSAARLTHGLFVHGFDIPLHDESQYQMLYRQYAAMFERLGLALLQARTNAYLFSQLRLDWIYAYPGPLVGTALELGNLLKRFYRPGSCEIMNGRIKAPSLFMDILSTETMDIVVDEPALPRSHKLFQLVEWAEAQRHLRVCMGVPHSPDGRACYRCAKCLEAAVLLDLFEAREKFVNFPYPMNWRRFVFFGWLSGGLMEYYYPDLPQRLREYRRYDLYLLYWLLAIPNEGFNFLRRKLLALIPQDFKYYLKRRLYASQLPPMEAAHGKTDGNE